MEGYQVSSTLNVSEAYNGFIYITSSMWWVLDIKGNIWIAWLMQMFIEKFGIPFMKAWEEEFHNITSTYSKKTHIEMWY